MVFSSFLSSKQHNAVTRRAVFNEKEPATQAKPALGMACDRSLSYVPAFFSDPDGVLAPLPVLPFDDEVSPQPMAVTTSAPATRSNVINLFTARPSFPEGA
jgi:hypothetical protein